MTCHQVKGESLGRPEVFSLESKDITAKATCRQRKSLRKLVELKTKERSYSSIHREWRKTSNKPYHVIKKPKINEAPARSELTSVA